MGMSSGSNSRMTMTEINVTPLVDVMLVLLIMFMVTAPLMQQGIEVDLPKTSSTGVEPKEDPLILVISSDKSMSIAKQKITIDQLPTKLKAIFETRKSKSLYLQADRHVEYGVVAEVMAEVKKAGINNMGLITLPKDQ